MLCVIKDANFDAKLLAESDDEGVDGAVPRAHDRSLDSFHAKHRLDTIVPGLAL